MAWLRIREWFRKGMERLRWFLSLLIERIRVELAMVKLLNNIEDLKRKRAEIVLKVGQRVLEMKDSPAHDLLSDGEIKSLLKEIDAIEGEIEREKERARELSRLED